MKNESKAIGAKARAEKLTPEERSEIASKAALARWDTPRATHRGELHIGDIAIPCAVLEDGRRVISEHGISSILGSSGGKSYQLRAKQQEDGTGPLPIFIASKPLKPFIDGAFETMDLIPIDYFDGKFKIKGYSASILPKVCEVWLRAKDAGVLQSQQLNKALKAEMLMRALAHVGISALVDEATGYQEVRDKLALQAILDKYLAKELAAWAKRFPDEFYKEMFRLKKWEFNPSSIARPGVVGHYTVDLVYERLAPGLVEELEKLNPKKDTGLRKSKHHQWLSVEVGHPALAQHLHAVIGFMRVSSSWEQLILFMDRAFPKKGKTIPLLFD